MDHAEAVAARFAPPCPAARAWVLRFGRFEVERRARRVLRDREPVELGGRAFDLLVTLLESRGHVMTKADLVEAVWPGMHMEESNLRFQIRALRRALDDHCEYVKTVPGRGYFFVDDRPSSPDMPGPSRAGASHRRRLEPMNAPLPRRPRGTAAKMMARPV